MCFLNQSESICDCVNKAIIIYLGIKNLWKLIPDKTTLLKDFYVCNGLHTSFLDNKILQFVS